MCVVETSLIKLIGFANESHHFLYKGTFSNRYFLFQVDMVSRAMQYKIAWRPLTAITDPFISTSFKWIKMEHEPVNVLKLSNLVDAPCNLCGSEDEFP